MDRRVFAHTQLNQETKHMKQIQIAASALTLALMLAPSASAEAAGKSSSLSQARPAKVGMTAPRIIGGVVSQPGTRNYTVRTSGCGGTIIADSWVLTAAHCGRQTEVKAGATDLNDPNIKTYKVIKYIQHPGYRQSLNGFTHPEDFALLQIEGTFPANLTRAKLPDATVMQAVAKPGDPLMVTGWGEMGDGNQYTRYLREVSVPVVSDEVCSSSVAYGSSLHKVSGICAGFQQGGKDSCQGDSGGPAVATYNNQIYSIGVVSWGDGCAEPNKYGVYSEVANYVNWINSHIGGSTTPPPTGSTVVHNVNLPSVSRGSWSSTYTVVIPAGTTKLVVNTSGGTGDADLYVYRDSAPSSSVTAAVNTSTRCVPYRDGNTETCTFNNPVAGTTYYIRVRAYSSFSGVNMKATRTP
jgi:secreted trypsin-like serine protease